MKIKELWKDEDLSILQIKDDEMKTVIKDENFNESLVIQNKDGWKISVEKDLELKNEQ